MNVDQETIVNKFVAAMGELHASAGETPQHASVNETPQHASPDETPLRAMDKGRPDRWRQIATWSLASIALFAVWMLGILSRDWLGGSR
jgi:hypothetical protein